MPRGMPRPRTRALAVRVALAIGGLAPRPAAAQLPPQFSFNYGENETPRAAALGGATRALGNGTTGVLQNPSAMVETRAYHIEALAQFAPEVGRQVYGGIIEDSMTSRLAGGISVLGGFLDPDGLDRSFIDARLALAYPLADRFFVGIAGRYAKVTQEGLGTPLALGDSKASGGLKDDSGRSAFVNNFTFDAGVTVKATDAIHIAALGQNLTYPNNGILPTTFGGGIGYGTSDLSLEVDGLADFNSYTSTSARVMAGGEYLAADHFPIRLGYRYDQGAKLHALSAGLGYIQNEFSVEASVRRTLSDPGATTVVIGLAYFLESSGLRQGGVE